MNPAPPTEELGLEGGAWVNPAPPTEGLGLEGGAG